MDRRYFLRATGAASAGLALPGYVSQAMAQAAEGRWKIYEVTHRVEVLKPAGITRIWLPTPLTDDTAWHKSLTIAELQIKTARGFGYLFDTAHLDK